jgi:pimeloyl-ACP methyl ester carboxylesterase
LVIADRFARHGIATIRYDKRGVAQSTGSYSTSSTLDFADDAESVVRYVATRRDIDPRRIGILGHSEGGMIAPMVAVRSPSVAFVILLAAPGLPGDVMMLRQVEIRDTAAGKDPESDPELRENRRLYAALRAGRDSADAASRLDAAAARLLAVTPESAHAVASQRLDRKRAILLTPFWRFLAVYDPRPTLRQLRKPVLAVTGTLDVQAPSKENLPEIAAALRDAGNRDVSIVEMPGLNHLFQTAVGVSPADYAKIEEIMAPRALDVITDWLLEHVKR